MFIKNPAYVPLGGESANLLPPSHIGEQGRLKKAYVIKEQVSLPDRINGALFKMMRDFRQGAAKNGGQTQIDKNVASNTDPQSRASMQAPCHKSRHSSLHQRDVTEGQRARNSLGEFVRNRQAGQLFSTQQDLEITILPR